MKKQLKLLSVLVLMALMLPMMLACGNSDDDGVDLDMIVGTWMCVKSIDSYQGKSAEGLLIGAEVTIKSNGTYTSTAESFGRSGTYTYNGETFTAKSHSGDTFVINAKVSKNDMEWRGTASSGVSFTYSFKRE